MERAEIQYEPNGRSRGSGVVEFDSDENAETAICKRIVGLHNTRHANTFCSKIHWLHVWWTSIGVDLRQVHECERARRDGWTGGDRRPHTRSNDVSRGQLIPGGRIFRPHAQGYGSLNPSKPLTTWKKSQTFKLYSTSLCNWHNHAAALSMAVFPVFDHLCIEWPSSLLPESELWPGHRSRQLFLFKKL